MKTKLLKEGDVIKIIKGMKVYSKIPEKFAYSNLKFSNKIVSKDIEIGKVYSNDINIEDITNNISMDIVKSFNFYGLFLSIEDIKDFILIKLNQHKLELFTMDEGEFVVTKIEYSGGGTMGIYDVYPDGYRVFCKRLKDGNFDENGVEVDFYQTGSFNAMITDIEPIGKLKMTFIK